MIGVFKYKVQNMLLLVMWAMSGTQVNVQSISPFLDFTHWKCMLTIVLPSAHLKPRCNSVLGAKIIGQLGSQLSILMNCPLLVLLMHIRLFDLSVAVQPIRGSRLMKVLLKYKTILSTKVALTINYKNSDTCKHAPLSISHMWYMVNLIKKLHHHLCAKLAFQVITTL